MANIHTINDNQPQRRYRPNRAQHNDPATNHYLNNRQDGDGGALGSFGNLGAMANNEGGSFLTIENLRFAEQNKVMFLSGRRRFKPPQDQNYLDMLMQACCPVIKLLSWTIFIIIVDLVMFIVSLSLENGLLKEGSLLQVNPNTLIKLGGNEAVRLRDGQVYRLLGAMVLHADFLHFFGNVVTTLIFVSRIEYTYGTIKTAIFYIIAGIGGNIFSALTNPGTSATVILVKVGASTSLYGVLGLILGYVIINWYGLNLVGPLMKCQLVCIMLFVILFIIIFTSAAGNIDVMGHIGGGLTGLWLSAFHATLKDEFCERVTRGIFIGLLIIQFLLCFLLFYLLPREDLFGPGV